MKTRCKDKNGNYIYEGDILHVEGWDKNEYLNQIRQLLNSIGGAK